jgi:hypothetical protein
MLLSLLLSCTPDPPRALEPGERPNLALIVADGATGDPSGPLAALSARWPQTFSAGADLPRDHRLILTSTWSSPAIERPNTLPGVLSLYGYRAEARLAPDFLPPADQPLLSGFTATAPAGCLEDLTLPATEPFFLLLHQPAGCPDGAALTALDAALTAADLAERTLVVALGSAGADRVSEATRVPFVARDPRGVLRGDAHLGTSLDVLPTLLTAAGAVVPSDAWGADRAAAPQRPVIVQRGPGQMSLRTDRHRLTLPDPARAAELPEGCPREGARFEALPGAAPAGGGAAGETTSEETAYKALCEALYAWRINLEADTARERMGDEAFGAMLRDGGYW